MSRADKLRALSRDPGATEGERLAAVEALERHERANPTIPPPAKHTKEWFAEVGRFRRHVEDLHCQAGALMPLDVPPMTWPEYKVLKNMVRYGADPFIPHDVSFIEMVERKLSARASNPDAQQNDAIALSYAPGITVEPDETDYTS